MSIFKVSLAAVALAAAAPSMAADYWLFGYSPVGSQLLVTDAGSVQASQTGWFDNTGLHSGGNTNYFAGTFNNQQELRNYFSFNVQGSFTSAELQIGNLGGLGPSGGVNLGPYSSLTWTLYDLATTIDTQQTYTNAIGIYNDLGSGTVYGSVTVSGATTLVTVQLNAAGLAALNRAGAGSGVFNVGGALDERVVPNPGAVPEPATWAMMIMGFGLVGFAARRRQASVLA